MPRVEISVDEVLDLVIEREYLNRSSIGQTVAAIKRALENNGLCIVPKKPTDAMICAAVDFHDRHPHSFSYSTHYAAMIEAAQKPRGR